MPRATARSAYGELADAAGKLPVPDKPKLKDPKDFTLIGKPLKRSDTPDKSDGKTIYGIDAMVPDMKFATLAQCPVLGGKVEACRRQCRERNFPVCVRSSCWTISSPSSATTCGLPGRASMR